MTVWNTPSVSVQKTLTLQRWQVLELANGNRHLVGFCVENHEGRVSTPVKHLEALSLRASTESGRTYVLEGEPGNDADAEYVWRKFAAVNSANSWVDVTKSVWDAHSEQPSKNRQ